MQSVRLPMYSNGKNSTMNRIQQMQNTLRRKIIGGGGIFSVDFATNGFYHPMESRADR